MAVVQTWFGQDLQKAVKVNHLDGNLFSHNGNGNIIGVRVYNDGEPVTLTGTVSGYVITSDGSTVPCVGARSGNEATITIPPAAYQPGNAFITIFLTDGSTVTTLCAAQTTVLQARTGSQVSPGSVVQDWTQTINAAMQSVEDAAENLGGIIATPYASLTYPVPLGKYTYYNSNLYRCISPIETSEEFTAAHWIQVKLGDDVSALKSALSVKLIMGEGRYVDYNTTDYTLTFPANTVFVCPYRGGYIKHLLGDSDYVVSNITSSAAGTGAIKIFIDPSDWSFKLVNFNYNATAGWYYLCTIRISGGYPVTICGDFPWSVNGVPYNIQNIVVPSEFKGFYTADGAVSSPGDTTKEVHTGLIRCNNGDEFVFSIEFTSSVAMWNCYVLYDRNGDFIANSRTVFWSQTGSQKKSSFTINNANVYYISFSYRTYGTSNVYLVLPPNRYIMDDLSHINEIENEFKYLSASEYLCAMIASGSYKYIEIDTTEKTISIPDDLIIVLNRSIDSKKYVILSNTVLSYSNISSTTLKLYYDVSAGQYYIKTYSQGRPNNNCVLILTVRTTFKTVGCTIPVIVDGKFMGYDFGLNVVDYVNNNIRVINHRGYNTVAPENTMPAFKMSRTKGFKYVETDVHFTLDGEAVLIHDDTIDRTFCNASDGSAITGNISVASKTYAELLEYDACTPAQWATYKGTKIPKLTDFLVFCKKTGIHPYLELKAGTNTQIAEIVNAVNAVGLKGHVTYISQSLLYLQKVVEVDKTAHVGYIVSSVTASYIDDAITLKTGENEVMIDCYYTGTGMESDLMANGIGLELWTINSTSQILSNYATGYTTDSVLLNYNLYVEAMQ